MLPRPIQKFIDVFSRLPSMGPRQATRLAFYLVGLGKASLAEIVDATRGLQSLQTCPDCFFMAGSGQACPFCLSAQRNKKSLAIVEGPIDVLALEKTHKFNGVYLVFGGLNKTGVLDPDQKLKLQRAKARGPYEEIIIAFNPTTYGDLNGSLVAEELKGATEKIVRLGRGMPTGGEIEFADEDTLGGALDNRR